MSDERSNTRVIRDGERPDFDALKLWVHGWLYPGAPPEGSLMHISGGSYSRGDDRWRITRNGIVLWKGAR